MLKARLHALVVLFTTLAVQTALGQSETPATVPGTFFGTYTLDYDLVNDGGPFVADEQVTLVLRPDNSLCVNDRVLTAPVFRGGNQVEAIWKDEANGLEYAVSNFQGSFNEVNVTGSSAAPFYGQLTGAKSSDATTCGDTPEVTASMSAIFELAESKLAEFFPSGAATHFLDNYVYRYYAATGIYLAFADGNVYLLGGAFGGEIVDAGSTDFVLAELEVYEPVVVSTGSWDLTISGTLVVFGVNQSFAGIEVLDVPAPDMNDVQEIEDEIVTTLEGVATGISQVSIDVLTDSANERSFRVTFSAVANGVSVSYDLTYTYTR